LVSFKSQQNNKTIYGSFLLVTSESVYCIFSHAIQQQCTCQLLKQMPWLTNKDYLCVPFLYKEFDAYKKVSIFVSVV